jgi:copper(I)-binding protein
MPKSLRAAAMAACLLASLPLAASAHGFAVGSLKIGHPWALPTPNAAPTAAGYLTLTNSGPEPERLLGASTPAAARIEIHQMSMDGGIMRMRPVQGGLLVPPGQTVTISPSAGYHLMLIRPKAPLKVGDHIPATLRFARAGEVKVEFHVQAEPPKGAGEHAHGGAH